MTTNKLALRLGRVLEMMLRGPACFDFDNYLKANPDLVALPSREHLWMQFVLEDQFIGRKFWWVSLPACREASVLCYLPLECYSHHEDVYTGAKALSSIFSFYCHSCLYVLE